MEKKDKIAMLEQSLDRKLTTLEMYENRPRKWILYLVIVLAVTLLVGWSADDIHFTGLTATGTEVAKGYKTRDPKKTTSKFIVSRRKK